IDPQPALLQSPGGEFGVPPQVRRQTRKLDVTASELLPEPPFAIGNQRLAQLPAMNRIRGIELFDPGRLQTLPNRLEELLAVLLDQRLEKCHPKHLPFPFVDARSQELMDLVAEQVAVQKGPSAVRLHEQLDGCFL